MNTVFRFGETQPGFNQPVLNEREVRGAAGTLFLFALVAFMSAWQLGNFQFTRVFVVAFLADFVIRVLINPRHAPSLVLARLAVVRQAPEWVGAPQKRFAWSIGLVLATIMLYLVVIERVVGPFNLAICALCLVLLFFESAFGICLACGVYNAFHRERARDCPGGVCEVERAAATRGGAGSLVLLLAFAGFIGAVTLSLPPEAPRRVGATADGSLAKPAPCQVPDWAKAMGHEEMWKLHNNCD